MSPAPYIHRSRQFQMKQRVSDFTGQEDRVAETTSIREHVWERGKRKTKGKRENRIRN